MITNITKYSETSLAVETFQKAVEKLSKDVFKALFSVLIILSIFMIIGAIWRIYIIAKQIRDSGDDASKRKQLKISFNWALGILIFGFIIGMISSVLLANSGNLATYFGFKSAANSGTSATISTFNLIL